MCMYVHAYVHACESECVCLHGSIHNTSTDANTCVRVCVCVCVCVMQGSGGVKEVFLGGSLGIESTVSKQMATFAARVSGTK